MSTRSIPRLTSTPPALRRRMGGRLFVAACSLAVCALPSVASANYACSGTVSGVSVSPSGVVSAESAAGLSWQRFCSVSEPSPNGVRPSACRATLAVLLTAQLTGRTVTVHFTGSDDATLCQTAYPPGRWLPRAWYLGPVLNN